MRVFIIDDQLAMTKRLRTVVASYFEGQEATEIVAVEYPQKFYKELPELLVRDDDLFFLDIDLNTSFSGVDLGKHLRMKNKECYIVYLTNYENNAISVINENITPWQFLVKEHDDESFLTSIYQVLNSVLEDIQEKNGNDQSGNFEFGNQTLIIQLKEIIYLKSISGYKNTLILKTNHSEQMIDGTLKKMKKLYTQDFFCSELKSYLINVKNITSWSKVDQSITFSNGEELELGVKQIDKLVKYIKHSPYFVTRS